MVDQPMAQSQAELGASELRVLCFLPSIPLGGMERAVIRLVDELRNRGAQAHYVLEERWAKEVQHQVQSTGVTWTGVPFVAALARPKTLLEFRWAMRSFLFSSRDLDRVAKSYQPKQLLVSNISAAYFARDIARRSDLLSVFRLPNPPGKSQIRAKLLFDRSIWRSVYRSFDRLICNSCYTASLVADIVGDDTKLKVIRNFPPALRFLGIDEVPPRKENIKRIVYLGQIARHKGVDILVETMTIMMKERKDVELVLAGPDIWRDNFGEEIRTRVRTAGLSSQIQFLGPVSNVHGLLASADIHVCPSISDGESFPNVVIEAKQVGVPSLVFPTAGLSEAITDNRDGIVTQDRDVSSLYEAISRILDDPILRDRLAVGARKSLAHYDASILANQWIEVLTAKKSVTL